MNLVLPIHGNFLNVKYSWHTDILYQYLNILNMISVLRTVTIQPLIPCHGHLILYILKYILGIFQWFTTTEYQTIDIWIWKPWFSHGSAYRNCLDSGLEDEARLCSHFMKDKRRRCSLILHVGNSCFTENGF